MPAYNDGVYKTTIFRWGEMVIEENKNYLEHTFNRYAPKEQFLGFPKNKLSLLRVDLSYRRTHSRTKLFFCKLSIYKHEEN